MLLWLDAAGLALFCVTGADRALTAGAGAFIAVAMGVVTATFGGVIRDILGGESPLILRKEVYVTAALAGAAAFVALKALGVPDAMAAVAGFAACFAIRALALSYGWSLPVYRAREGRTDGGGGEAGETSRTRLWASSRPGMPPAFGDPSLAFQSCERG